MGIIMRNGVAYGGGGGDNSTFIGTTAQWEALTTSEKAQYNIVDFTDDYSPGNGFRPLLIIYTATGSTVTVSKTGVSVTAEEVSEGKFVADIPDWGTYTITAVLDSSEITEEIIINTVQIYEVTLGNAIPEGATVLPTDDIQTWLACANITDKSYTTLAEVLADRETFETLISDSNACDYMARSTSWADNITSATGLIPVMTSNTTPSGTASSTNPQTGREAYRALDGDDSTLCNDLGNTNPPIELTYEFPEKVCIKGIRLKYARIASGKIQALDDNNSWVDLVTVTSLSDSTTIQDDYYSLLNNTTSYKKYRVYETASTTSATNAARMMVWNFQLYEDADITHTQDAMALIGKYDYCSNALLGNATWAEAIANSDYFEEVLNVKVPKMTSNTAPSGECIASGRPSASYEFYKAFDNDSSTLWQNVNSTYEGAYIGYHFPSSVIIERIWYRSRGQSGVTSNATGKIQGSNDGNNWTDLSDTLSFKCCDSSQVEYTWNINNNTAYSYYRLYFLTGSNPSQVSPCANELQFYGRKSVNATNTNGIIHTANGDTVTCNGNTYVADTNGIIEIDFSDFDEGTYTFTSGIAKDPTNLSNYYSKSFKITKSPYGGTTELYLMPDAVKTLYWWGYGEAKATASNYRPSWTGVSFVAPTIANNTNNISITQGGNYGSTFFNTPEINSGDITVNVVAKSSSSSGDNLYQLTPAYQNSYTYLSGTNVTIQNTSMTKYSQSYSGTSSRIIPVFQSNNSTVNIYAIWYE